MKSRGVFFAAPAPDLKADAVDIEHALNVAGIGRYSYFLLLACCITHLGSVVDMLGYSIVVPAARCDLKLTLAQSGMLNSVSFAGFLFALPWGYFADIKGRRKALLISASFGFIFAALSSFSTNFLMMLIFKFIGCCFSTASMTLTTTFLGESVPKKYRNKFIFVQNSFNLAADFVCFGLAYIFLPLNFNLPISSEFIYKPWRLFTLTLSLPLGIGALMTMFLYESPKFLSNKGEMNRALGVLTSVYQWNRGDQSFPVKKLMVKDDIEKSLAIWESIIKQTVPIFIPPLLWTTIKCFYLLAICCTISNVFFMWFPTMVNSFYNNADEGTSFCQKININMTSKINLDDNEFCNETTPMNTIYAGMLFSIFFVVVNIIATKLSSWRKLLLIITFALSACGSALVNIFENPVATMVFFIMIQFTGTSIGTVASYFVEIYPTSHRGLASSLGMMVARMTCIGGVNIVGAVLTDHCQLIFYVWTALALSGIIAALFLPTDRSVIK